MLSIDEINNLQEENKELKSKLKRLQRQYNNVLDLAKKNADANEYCLQELEKRLEPFRDEYFIGLNEQQISELAKKSIRLTKENTQLIKHLEGIREEAKNSLQVGLMISSWWLKQKVDEVLND